MTEKDRVWGSEETTPTQARITEHYRCGHTITTIGADWQEAHAVALKMRRNHACQ